MGLASGSSSHRPAILVVVMSSVTTAPLANVSSFHALGMDRVASTWLVCAVCAIAAGLSIASWVFWLFAAVTQASTDRATIDNLEQKPREGELFRYARTSRAAL